MKKQKIEEKQSIKETPARKSGVFTKIKLLMEKNRLGELLVLNGYLTTKELRYALQKQKEDGAKLGNVLLAEELVSKKTLYKILSQQVAMRCLTASIGVFIMISSLNIKQARAGSIKDIPSHITLASAANPAFSPVQSYPALFGSAERASSNLSAFTKWTGMFDRFEAAMSKPSSQNVMKAWKQRISGFQNLPLESMAERVNSYINEQPYIVDSRNWGKSDYWETPVEFFQRGGDCEDFAIAKYVSLRALGVPENRLRIAIVHDTQKDMPHAILIVYTDSGAMVLDNQNSRALDAQHISHYRPIFTINRDAWWLHTKPGANSTIVASR